MYLGAIPRSHRGFDLLLVGLVVGLLLLSPAAALGGAPGPWEPDATDWAQVRHDDDNTAVASPGGGWGTYAEDEWRLRYEVALDYAPSTPTVTDIDGDGVPEIALTTSDSTIDCDQIPANVDEAISFASSVWLLDGPTGQENAGWDHLNGNIHFGNQRIARSPAFATVRSGDTDYRALVFYHSHPLLALDGIGVRAVTTEMDVLYDWTTGAATDLDKQSLAGFAKVGNTDPDDAADEINFLLQRYSATPAADAGAPVGTVRLVVDATAPWVKAYGADTDDDTFAWSRSYGGSLATQAKAATSSIPLLGALGASNADRMGFGAGLPRIVGYSAPVDCEGTTVDVKATTSNEFDDDTKLRLVNEDDNVTAHAAARIIGGTPVSARMIDDGTDDLVDAVVLVEAERDDAGNPTSWVVVLDASTDDFSELWRSEAIEAGLSAPAVADVDDDGAPDVVVAGIASDLEPVAGNRSLWVVDGAEPHGLTPYTAPDAGANNDGGELAAFDGPTVVDAVGNGWPWILLTLNRTVDADDNPVAPSKLVALNASSLAPLWEIPLVDDMAPASPICADVDGDDDGRCEIVVGTGAPPLAWGANVNRLRVYEPNAPDLELAGLRVTEDLVVGQPVDVLVNVTNDGYADANGVVVRLLAEGNEIDSDPLDIPQGTTVQVTLPWTPGASAQDLELKAVADATKQVPELVETDNKATTTVDVNAAPEVSFALAPAVPDPGETVNFTDASVDRDGLIDNWTWDFGDDSPLEYAQNTTHAYEAAGEYHVNLTVRDDDGTTNSTIQSLRVNAAPVAYFVSSPPAPDDGTDVEFDAADSYDPDGGALNHSWNFDDNSAGAGVNTTHNFPDNGTYTVRLTVTDPDGATAIHKEEVVVSNAPPVASFTYNPMDPDDAANVTFDANDSHDPSGGGLTYAWNFGDNSTGAGVNTTHNFPDNGTYTVRLTVTDPDGATAIHKEEVVVSNAPPVASFTFGPTDPEPGETVSFDANASSDPSGGELTYAWNFGDNSTGMGVTPNNTYAASGDYAVTLTVTDEDGATAEAHSSVMVNEPPTAAFTFTPDVPEEGQTVLFTGNGSDVDGSIENWTWDFGDDTPRVYTQNATHAYTSSGDYVVNLTIKDNDEATGQTAKTVPVNAKPQANFTHAPDRPGPGEEVNFTDQSSDTDGIIENWTWDFGDDTPRVYTQNATHAFDSEGDFDVKLTVRDDDGATDSFTKRLTTVNDPPVAEFSAGMGVLTVSFDGTLSSDPDGDELTYGWSFGDGGNGTGATPSHTYADPGEYEVTLTVSDGDLNHFATKSVVATCTVTEEGFEEEVLGDDCWYSTDRGTSGEDTQWKIRSTDQDECQVHGGTRSVAMSEDANDDCEFASYAYGIDEDDELVSPFFDLSTGGQSPRADYHYWASMYGCGQVDQEFLYVYVRKSPDDAWQVIGKFCNDDRTWINEEKELGDSYLGSSLVQLRFRLWSDGSGGKKGVFVDDVQVTTEKPPTAAFTRTPLDPNVDQSVAFTDQSTDPDDQVDDWFWDFGDGANSTVQNPNHTFTTSGDYRVTLSVTDEHGNPDTVSATVHVVAHPPEADYTYSPGQPNVDQSVSFTDQSTDPDDDIDSWSWDFGDGSPLADTQNTSHAYAAAGDYTVKLTVTDEEELTDTITKTIHVVAGPSADFTYSPSEPDPNEAVHFTDTSRDADQNIASWQWEFGDGGNSTLQNPTHTYTDCGDYKVKLKVTDADGLDDDVTKIVKVRDEVVQGVRTCIQV